MAYIVTERYYDNGKVVASYEYTSDPLGRIVEQEQRSRCDVYRSLAMTERAAKAAVKAAKAA